MMTYRKTLALERACPTCNAQPFEPCRRIDSGELAETLHAARFKHAPAADGERR